MLQIVLQQAGELAGGNSQQIHNEHRAVSVHSREDTAQALSGAADGFPAVIVGKSQQKPILMSLPGFEPLPRPATEANKC